MHIQDNLIQDGKMDTSTWTLPHDFHPGFEVSLYNSRALEMATKAVSLRIDAYELSLKT